jgi:hypothetical protein
VGGLAQRTGFPRRPVRGRRRITNLSAECSARTS